MSGILPDLTTPRASDDRALKMARARLADINSRLKSLLKTVERSCAASLKYLETNDEFVEQNMMKNNLEIDGLATERTTLIRILTTVERG